MTVLILSAMVASWHPAGAALMTEDRSGTLSCNPAQASINRVERMCSSSRHVVVGPGDSRQVWPRERSTVVGKPGVVQGAG